MSLLYGGVPFESYVSSFEGSLGAWGGDTASFATVTTGGPGAPVHGDQYLEEQDDGTADSIITSKPGDGLDNYPEAGDTHQFYHSIEVTDDRVWIQFCADETDAYDTYSDAYYIDWDHANTAANLRKWSGSSGTTLVGVDYSGQSPNTTDWWRFYIDHTSAGDFTYEVYDGNGDLMGSGTATDTDYTSGAVKVRRLQTTSYMDAWEVL